MSLMALELEGGIRRANPPVFCRHLRLHNNPISGRTTAWFCPPEWGLPFDWFPGHKGFRRIWRGHVNDDTVDG